jgi:hypothetical protein
MEGALLLLGRYARLNQALEHLHIPFFIARFVHWRLGYESAMRKARIVKQPAERFNSDGPLADVRAEMYSG